MNSFLFKLIWSRSRDWSSETRRPVEYRVSKIARSRAPFKVLVSGISNRASSSSLLRTSTVLSSIFGSSIFSGARVGMSFFVKYFRKALSAMTW